jgi:hypothetical protein
MLVFWTVQTICFALYAKHNSAAAGHAVVVMICECKLKIWGWQWLTRFYSCSHILWFLCVLSIQPYSSFTYHIIGNLVDVCFRKFGILNYVINSLSKYRSHITVWWFREISTINFGTNHWFFISRYSIEILPYALRAKGFAIFGFVLCLSLIFNQ